MKEKINAIELIDSTSFFRISISILALVSIVSYGTDYTELFSGKSINIATMHEASGFKGDIAYKILFFISNYSNSENLFNIFRNIYIISLILLAIGFLTRITAITAFVSNMLIFQNSPLLLYGYDDFLYLSLLICIFFDVSTKLSIDDIFFEKRNPKPSLFLLLFIRATLCVCYFFSGLSKATDGYGWWNGQKIINSLHYDVTEYGLRLIDFLSEHTFIPVILGIFTIVIEISYPVLLFFRKARAYLLFSTVTLHIGIAILMRLTEFSVIMIIWNIVALYDFEDDLNYEQSYFYNTKSQLFRRFRNLIR